MNKECTTVSPNNNSTTNHGAFESYAEMDKALDRMQRQMGSLTEHRAASCQHFRLRLQYRDIERS